MGFRGILVIFRFRGYIGHFLDFGGYFVIFWVLGVLWSFFEFWGILVIFRFWGYFGHFLGFRGYFGHFSGFKAYLVILEISGVLVIL